MIQLKPRHAEKSVLRGSECPPKPDSCKGFGNVQPIGAPILGGIILHAMRNQIIPHCAITCYFSNVARADLPGITLHIISDPHILHLCIACSPESFDPQDGHASLTSR